MALPIKPDMTHVWASGGAKVAPSNTKIDTGWTAEVPPFQWENHIQNRQDQYLSHLNVSGFPVWDGLTNYEGAGQSLTKGSDGIIYKSVAPSGPSTTVQDPATDVSDTYWTVAFASVGAFLTQASADSRYTQRANNLSDLTNVATARTNLGVTNAVEGGITSCANNLRASTTGTNASVSITADQLVVKNSSNQQKVLNSVSVTASLAATGVNGLDTGVSVASTWYYAYVIWNGTTTSGLLSLSATSPILPSGYTYFARVSSLFTDPTANKYPFSMIQRGRSIQYVISPGTNLSTSGRIMATGTAGNNTTPIYAAVSVANFVPPTAGIIFVTYAASSSVGGLLAPNPNYGAGYSITNPAFQFTGNTGGVAVNVRMLLESVNIYWASTGAALSCTGYEDTF